MHKHLVSVFTHQDIMSILSADFGIKDFASLSQSCRFFRGAVKDIYLARLEQLLLDIDAVEKMSLPVISKCIDFVKAHNPDKAYILLNSIVDDEVKFCLNPWSRPRSTTIRVPSLEDFQEEVPALAHDDMVPKEEVKPRVLLLEEMLIEKFGLSGFFGERTAALMNEARTVVYLATLQAVLASNPKDQSLRLINLYFNWLAHKNFGKNPERHLERKNKVIYSRFLNKPIETLIAEFVNIQRQDQNITTLTKLLSLFFGSMKSKFSSSGLYEIHDPWTMSATEDQLDSFTEQDPIIKPKPSNPIHVLIDQWLEFEYKYFKNVDKLDENTIRLLKKFTNDFFSYLQLQCELLRKADLLFPKKDVVYFENDKLYILEIEVQKLINSHVESRFEDAEGAVSKDSIIAELTAAVDQEIAKLKSLSDLQSSSMPLKRA